MSLITARCIVLYFNEVFVRDANSRETRVQSPDVDSDLSSFPLFYLDNVSFG
jgi:hypothetical protein